MLSTAVFEHLPPALPSDPLPCPSSPSSSEASDDHVLSHGAHDAQLPAQTASGDESSEPLVALEALQVQVGRLKAVVSQPAAAPAPAVVESQHRAAAVAESQQDAVPWQQVRLLETELRDKDSLLQQEQREVEKLKQEILSMDAEREMFEKQLSAAEDSQSAGVTRFRRLQDVATRLEKDVACLKEDKAREVTSLQLRLDAALSSVEQALDQPDATPAAAVAGAVVVSSVLTEHADRLEETGGDEVDVWTGRYMNGRSVVFLPFSPP